MHLDVFDGRIVDVLRAEGRPMTLAELVKAAGFARSTVIIHLERLMSNGLVLREKKPGGARGRPKFIYRLIKTPESKAAFQPSIVPIEFSSLRKACRYEKGGYATRKGCMLSPKLQTHNKAKVKHFCPF